MVLWYPGICQGLSNVSFEQDSTSRGGFQNIMSHVPAENLAKLWIPQSDTCDFQKSCGQSLEDHLFL